MSTYKYSDKTQLTEHFNVSEFRCKCGGTHDTIVDPALPQKLEQLRSKLNCRSIVVTSGYRCSTHDKAVGGYGTGQHTKGTAADIVCTGSDGKTIDARRICCAAQDIGFGGIGRISDTAAHVDVRTSNFWKGDETVPGGTSSSITTDFYSYYKLSKAEVYGTAKVSKSVSLTIDGKTYSGTLSEM